MRLKNVHPYLALASIGLAACSETPPDTPAIIWNKLATIESSDEVFSVNTAIDSRGNLTLSWQTTESREADGNSNIECHRSNVLMRRYNAAKGAWGDTTTLQQGEWRRTATKETNDENWKTIAFPLNTKTTLAADDNGNIIATWIQDTSSNCDSVATLVRSVYQSIYSASSNSWSSPELLIGSPTQNADDLSLAVNGDGAAIVSWSQWDENEKINLVYASYYDSVDTWDTPVIVSGDDGGTPLSYFESVTPQVGIRDNGDAAVFWRQHNNGIYEIQARNYTTDNAWSDTVITVSSNTVDTSELTVTKNSSGSYWAIWVERGEDGIGEIMANSLASDDIVGAATSLKGDLSTTTEDERDQNAFSPKIIVDSNGNVTASWLQVQTYTPQSNKWNNSNSVSIWSNHMSAGSWSGSKLAMSEQRESVENMHLSIRESTPILTWTQNNDALEANAQSVYSAKFTSSTWSDAALVSNAQEATRNLSSTSYSSALASAWLNLQTNSSGTQQASLGIAIAK